MHRLNRLVSDILASPKLFWLLVILLALQALWVAFTFSYPMLWDEYYHFGLIQYYSQHISPIIVNQPESLDLYGNVARSPKYLYHYLLSFPLRPFAFFVDSQMAQIIYLRIINIAMFVGALVVYRQALLKVVPSQKVMNVAMFVIAMLPLSSLLAGQINYDNLQFLLSGVIIYFAIKVIQSRYTDVTSFLIILGTSGLASVVKHTILPIVVAIVGYLVVQALRTHGKSVLAVSKKSFTVLSSLQKVLLILLVVIGGGLAVERFGGNILQYHSVEPRCDKVLGVERCLNFSPFKQEYNDAQKDNERAYQAFGVAEPLAYTAFGWLPESYKQYFITGTQTGPENFAVSEPLPIPFYTMLAATFIGATSLVIYLSRRSNWQDEVQMLLLACLALATALWLVNYEKYTRTGYPLAIQGRYFLPILPAVLFLAIHATNQVIKHKSTKTILVITLVLGLLAGGGLLTHTLLADSSWYWVA